MARTAVDLMLLDALNHVNMVVGARLRCMA